MQFVVEIPNECVTQDACFIEWVQNAGKDFRFNILPSGHGRLIDACEAEKVMMDVMCGTGYQSDAMRVLRSDFYTPTVIEADEKEQ